MTSPVRPPSYRYHKARKCTVVTIDGRDRYLGAYNSPESLEKYGRLVAEWRAVPRATSDAIAGCGNQDLRVKELAAAYPSLSFRRWPPCPA